ncbi:MAG TPA: HPF/RaiA family ribosome-associated protein [Polyangiaceae bacterium]
MQVQITFRDMPPSETLAARIQTRISKLAKLCPQITSCHVTVDTPHRRPQKGRLFRVTLDVVLPDAEVAVSRDPGHDHGHEDAYVAVRDAFDALERRLHDHVALKRAAAAVALH